MSYCRFSSDNWRSDVYVYEHYLGHWQIEVAGRRRVLPAIPDFPLRLIPSFGGNWCHADRRMAYPSRLHCAAATAVFWLWARWHKVHMWSVRLSPMRDIGLMHDGDTFFEDSASACADRLDKLGALGYYVPQYAIDALRSDAAEGKQA